LLPCGELPAEQSSYIRVVTGGLTLIGFVVRAAERQQAEYQGKKLTGSGQDRAKAQRQRKGEGNGLATSIGRLLSRSTSKNKLPPAP